MVKEYGQEGNRHEANNKWSKCLAKMWDYTKTEGSLEAKMPVHIDCSRKPGLTSRRQEKRDCVFIFKGLVVEIWKYGDRIHRFVCWIEKQGGGREIVCVGCRHTFGDKKSKDSGGRSGKEGKA
jgi:hypothetical protein